MDFLYRKLSIQHKKPKRSGGCSQAMQEAMPVQVQVPPLMSHHHSADVNRAARLNPPRVTLTQNQ